MNGDIFFPTDGTSIQRSDGSAWSPWGPIFPLTDPALQTFAWVNQGGASYDTSKGGLTLIAPAASGQNNRILKRAAPATPYTITVGFIATMGPASGDPEVGVCFRESGSGKLHTFHLQEDGSSYGSINSTKYTNATTWSANYSTNSDYGRYLRLGGGPLNWFRIADDGANRICSWSNDGQNFLTYHTIGRTDFLTADEVGIFANSGQTTYDTYMNVLSFQVA